MKEFLLSREQKKCHCLMRKASDANIRADRKDMCLPASLTLDFPNIGKACQTFFFKLSGFLLRQDDCFNEMFKEVERLCNPMGPGSVR